MRWLFTLLLLTACGDRSDRTRTPAYDPDQPSTSSSQSDGGVTPEGGPSTAPTVTPQPGDIQI